jgi:5-methylthioadenosine/S-adenosylhomocysteine deaminase
MMAAVTRFAERWLPYAPMITPAFFCHSSYTCSPQTLVNVKATARAAGIKAAAKSSRPANPGIRRCPY